MNIHYIIGTNGYERVSTADWRKRTGEKKPTKKGTQPPRSREGLTGRGQGKTQRMAHRLQEQKAYPGGKRLRRAQARLSSSVNFYEGIKKGQAAFTKPGSMTL